MPLTRTGGVPTLGGPIKRVDKNGRWCGVIDTDAKLIAGFFPATRLDIERLKTEVLKRLYFKLTSHTFSTLKPRGLVT